MTHVANVDALTRLVSICSGYGGSYNPGRQSLQLNSLASQLAQARLTLNQVVEARYHYDNETNERILAYRQAGQLASRLVLALEAIGIEPERVEDAKGFFRQFIGKTGKGKRPVEGGAEEPLKARRSGIPQAYLSKAEYFASLVQMVIQEPRYQPNEPVLSKAALAEQANLLRVLNGRVTSARMVLNQARLERNQYLYNRAQSVYTTVKGVKNYVGSVFGRTSLQYDQVNQIKFHKP